MIAFTVLGYVVFLRLMFQAGWHLGLLQDLWNSGRAVHLIGTEVLNLTTAWAVWSAKQ